MEIKSSTFCQFKISLLPSREAGHGSAFLAQVLAPLPLPSAASAPCRAGGEEGGEQEPSHHCGVPCGASALSSSARAFNLSLPSPSPYPSPHHLLHTHPFPHCSLCPVPPHPPWCSDWALLNTPPTHSIFKESLRGANSQPEPTQEVGDWLKVPGPIMTDHRLVLWRYV